MQLLIHLVGDIHCPAHVKIHDDQVSKVAFEQMLIGGLRLAKVMNDLFD